MKKILKNAVKKSGAAALAAAMALSMASAVPAAGTLESDAAEGEEFMLTTGTDFRKKLSSAYHDGGDVTFRFTNDEVPEGYETVDVSAEGDDSIAAYYDDGTFCISTDGKAGTIFFNPDSEGMFSGCSAYWDGSRWIYGDGLGYRVSGIETNGIVDTGLVTDMRGMFRDYSGDLDDLSWLDTSNAADMGLMFEGFLGSVIDVSGFDTSSVTDMSRMFAGGSAEKIIGLENFDTSGATDMNRMFLDSGLEGPVDLSGWDLSSLENCSYMFHNCTALSGQMTVNIEVVPERISGMFSNCSVSQNNGGGNPEFVVNYTSGAAKEVAEAMVDTKNDSRGSSVQESTAGNVRLGELIGAHEFVFVGFDIDFEADTAEAVFECTDCEEEFKIEAVVTFEITKEAEGDEPGEAVYTAVAEYEGETYTESWFKAVRGTHVYDFDDIEWVWSEDYTSADAYVYCTEKDGAYLKFDAEVEIKKTGEGYTATASFTCEGETYSTEAVFDPYAPAEAHEHIYEFKEWHIDRDENEAYAEYRCVYGDVASFVRASVTSEISKEATQEEDGEITYAAVAEYEHVTARTSWTAVIPAFGSTDSEEITVVKVWEDEDDASGSRPESITVTAAYRESGAVAGSAVLNGENNWEHTFSGLDKDAGYEIREDEVPEGYEASYEYDKDGRCVITNTLISEPEGTDVTVVKKWNDNDRELRPESVMVILTGRDGEEYAAELSAENGWTYTFKDVAEGCEVIEADVPQGYEASYEYEGDNTIVITNTYVPVPGSPEHTYDFEDIEWVWADDFESARAYVFCTDDDAAFLTFDADVEIIGFDDGTYIAVASFVYEDETYSTVMVLNPIRESNDVPVIKIWNDADNADGIRPESVDVLLVDGNGEEYSATLSEKNDWSYVFEDIVGTYEVAELNVAEGYEASYKYTDSVVIVINTHEAAPAPEYTSVAVRKVWDDEGDADGLRPESVRIDLYANGEATGEYVNLSEKDDWAGVFGGLEAADADGSRIDYAVYENDVPEGYTSSVGGNAETGYVVINTHDTALAPEYTSVSVTKVWDDGDNADGLRPESVTAALYADGVDTGRTVVLSGENDWSYIFTGLEAGYAYTVSEIDIPDGYTAVVGGNAESGFVIINAHETAPAPEYISISVTKVWDDGDNADGLRPESVTAALYADGIDTGRTVVLSGGNDWSYTFTGLEAGYAYTVSETDIPDGYTAAVGGNAESGFVIINTHETVPAPEYTGFSVTKVWDDDDNADGLRHESVAAELYADGVSTGRTAVLSGGNNWSGSFGNLPVYGEDGNRIIYTVAEAGVPEGYTAIISGDADSGFVITNTHTSSAAAVEGIISDELAVNVRKVWNDNDNDERLRPDSVSVTLYKDGVDAETVTLSADNDWSYTFTGIFAGEVYGVREDDVPEYYSASYESIVGGDGTVTIEITNICTYTKTPGTVDLEIDKVWYDGSGRNRPDGVSVTIYRDGEYYASVEVSEAYEWMNKIHGLEAGHTYRIAEEVPYGYVATYEASFDENENMTCTVTNYSEEIAEELGVEGDEYIGGGGAGSGEAAVGSIHTGDKGLVLKIIILCAAAGTALVAIAFLMKQREERNKSEDN